MRKFALAVASAAIGLTASPALATPGLGGEIYGARVEEGKLEIETRWDQLTGGEDDGEDVMKGEVAYGVSDRFRLGIQTEFEKEPGEGREFEAIGIEGIYTLGEAAGIAFAIYGEYEIVFDGADKIETKLLMQHDSGPFDVKLNLIAEKELEKGEHIEFEYAASADVETFGEVRLGVEAFGELGTTRDFLPRARHFIGPAAKFEIEALGPEIEVGVGYLFPIAAATEETDGILRLGLEVEF